MAMRWGPVPIHQDFPVYEGEDRVRGLVASTLKREPEGSGDTRILAHSPRCRNRLSVAGGPGFVRGLRQIEPVVDA
jgi:hypothetical protein